MFLRRVELDDRECGATSVEYGLMITLISAVIIGAVLAIGGITNTALESPCAELAAVGKPC